MLAPSLSRDAYIEYLVMLHSKMLQTGQRAFLYTDVSDQLMLAYKEYSLLHSWCLVRQLHIMLDCSDGLYHLD